MKTTNNARNIFDLNIPKLNIGQNNNTLKPDEPQTKDYYTHRTNMKTEPNLVMIEKGYRKPSILEKSDSGTLGKSDIGKSDYTKRLIY
jgi:hypothetical protein